MDKKLIMKPWSIPNEEGFKFIGVLKSGEKVNCVVVKDQETHCHSVSGCDYNDLASWERYV